MTKYQKIWWFLWGIFFIFCILSYIYMLFFARNTQIVNIEYKIYFFVLFMAAVSVSPIKFGKILIWFILFCGLATIYNLSEFQKMTELEICAEGKCKTPNNVDIATSTNEETKKNNNSTQ